MAELPSGTPNNMQQASPTQPGSQGTSNGSQQSQSMQPNTFCSADDSQQSTLMNPFTSGTGICERTTEVCNAIVALIPQADHCSVVTDSHLAALTGELDLSNSGIASLQSGDFAGLTHLSNLLLSHNQLATLPAGIFSGLTDLQGLALSHNQLTTLPADIFSELTRLRSLRLNNNRLATLSADLFSTLVNLETLRLHTNALTSVPGGMFSSLAKLDILDLEFNQITALSTGIFDGLNLRFLGLEGNRLRSLQAGLFDSLGSDLDLTLDLSHNEITTLEDGVFANLENLVFLDLAHNQLQSLPAGIFAGLTSMRDLYLEVNPGANFILTMELQRIANTNKVVVVIAEGAPFDLTTTISAAGGVLEDGVTTVTVPVGHTRSDEITVTPLTGATVSLGAAPAIPPSNSGYRIAVGSPFSATSAMTRTVNNPLELSVADASAREATGATISFVVTMSRTSSATVKVDYETSDGTANAGEDYTSASDTLTFLPGETSKTVQVQVLNDSIDDNGETFMFTLSNPSGGNATLRDAMATGRIENTDPVPQAWLARFGRSVVAQVLDAVEGRMTAARVPGMELGLAGQRINGAMSLDGHGMGTTDAPLDAHKDGMGPMAYPHSHPGGRTITAHELFTDFSFALTGEAGGGGLGALWVQGAISHFDGHEGALSLDSEVQSMLLGADWIQGRSTVGVALSHSNGDGSFRSDHDEGDIRADLTGIYPYGQYELSEQLSIWGTVGYGEGRLKLAPKGKARVETGMDLRMAAVGSRGLLAKPSAAAGLELAVTSNAMIARTGTDSKRGSNGYLEASKAEVTRLRLGLKGVWHGIVRGSIAFEPDFEAGLRHDGGDAETGFGMDIAAGIALKDSSRGLQAMVRAHGLLTHEDGDFRERGLASSLVWEPNPASERGLRLSLSQTMGASASGGVEALLRPEVAQGLNSTNQGELDRHLFEVKLRYGMHVFGGGFTGTPEVGLGFSGTERRIRLGWLLEGPTVRNLGFNMKFEGSRQEVTNEERKPEYGIGLQILARW